MTARVLLPEQVTWRCCASSRHEEERLCDSEVAPRCYSLSFRVAALFLFRYSTSALFNLNIEFRNSSIYPTFCFSLLAFSVRRSSTRMLESCILLSLCGLSF